MTKTNSKGWRKQQLSDFTPGLTEKKATELMANMIREGRAPSLTAFAAELQKIKESLEKRQKKS